ncbi:MAG: carboxypeptidase regulatory-like domain-containing protein [Acidobacteriaceae bacterium]
MKLVRFSILFCCCLILLSGLPFMASAQSVSGSIRGTVKDSSGASIPNAQVTLTDTQRNVAIRTVKADNNGFYAAPQLPLATYSVSAEQTGFQKAVVDNVVLHVNDALTINLTLPVGSSSQSVTVSAASIQVNTENASSSTLISGQQVVSLPLNNRNYEQLVSLQPGVSYGGGDQLYIGLSNPSGQTNVVSFSINGQRTSQNFWTVDGADNVDGGTNLTLLIYPSVDAIAEFKTLRNTYSAEFGKSASGQINVVTKSGTNDFHGDAYEFLRNDDFAANSVLNKTAGIPRAPLRYNDFGYTIGGPVWIPKVYNGKDKTFFFFSQEIRRVITYGSSTLTGDPTAAMRNGIFPADVCVQQDASGTCTRVVPTGTPVAIDPTAQAYLKDIYNKLPLPNNAADATGTGLIVSLRNIFNENQQIARVDQVFSDHLQAYFRFVNDAIPTIEPNGLFTNAAGFPNVNTTSTNSPGRNYLGHVTWNITPKLLLDGGYAYSYGAILSDPTGLMATTNSPDIKPILPFVSALPRVPAITFPAGGAGLTTFGPYRDYNRDHNAFANVSRIFGQHSLRFGGTYHHFQKQENAGQANAGSYSFLNTAAPKGTPSFDQSFAYFLTGNYAAFSQTSEDITPSITYNQVEVYAQDDWKVTPRLTLNLGIRYSLFQQPVDQNNELTTFSPTTFSASNAPTIDTKGNICAKAPCAGGGTPNPNYNALNGIVVGGKGSKFGDKVAPTTSTSLPVSDSPMMSSATAKHRCAAATGSPMTHRSSEISSRTSFKIRRL